MGDLIRQELSDLLTRGAVHDPGIGFITLTRVKVSPDLQLARVFYTSMGHKPEVWKDAAFQKIVVAGLNWTSGKTEFDPKSNLKDTAPQPVAAAK